MGERAARFVVTRFSGSSAKRPAEAGHYEPVGSAPHAPHHTGALTPATAPHRLIGELMPRLNERLTGSGSTIGNPLIRAGSVLRLTGLGVRFGGLYRVKSATHTIDAGGYRTRFEVRKEVWLDGVPAAVQLAVPVRRPPAVKAAK